MVHVACVSPDVVRVHPRCPPLGTSARLHSMTMRNAMPSGSGAQLRSQRGCQPTSLVASPTVSGTKCAFQVTPKARPGPPFLANSHAGDSMSTCLILWWRRAASAGRSRVLDEHLGGESRRTDRRPEPGSFASTSTGRPIVTSPSIFGISIVQRTTQPSAPVTSRLQSAANGQSSSAEVQGTYVPSRDPYLPAEPLGAHRGPDLLPHLNRPVTGPGA